MRARISFFTGRQPCLAQPYFGQFIVRGVMRQRRHPERILELTIIMIEREAAAKLMAMMASAISVSMRVNPGSEDLPRQDPPWCWLA